MKRGIPIMIQGTASHAGKSLLTAIILRILSNLGYTVAPFKAQNMSLNSFVTADGYEIARSQAVQALAARCPLEKEMNPILLKPTGEKTSQVVLCGIPFKDMDINQYYSEFLPSRGECAVKEALNSVLSRYEVVVIEGAGSPSEINLYDRDITNMKTADIAESPVILVGDIERGGVFASLYGTYALLRDEHKLRVKGTIINKFRGEKSILQEGIHFLERETGVPVLGVMPFVEHTLLEEDSLGISNSAQGSIDITIIRLPHISNFTDFDPLKEERMRFVSTLSELGTPDAIILPGTKNTIEDLVWLHRTGLATRIQHLAPYTVIVGICGGFQMLGRVIIDEQGIEGSKKKVEGLSLLDGETIFTTYSKIVTRVEATVLDHTLFSSITGEQVTGYEIHMGSSTTSCSPLFSVEGKEEGAIQGTTFGTYLHGIFDNSRFCDAFLNYIRRRKGLKVLTRQKSIQTEWEESIETLSTVFLQEIDWNSLYTIIFGENNV